MQDKIPQGIWETVKHEGGFLLIGLTLERDVSVKHSLSFEY